MQRTVMAGTCTNELVLVESSQMCLLSPISEAINICNYCKAYPKVSYILEYCLSSSPINTDLIAMHLNYLYERVSVLMRFTGTTVHDFKYTSLRRKWVKENKFSFQLTLNHNQI